MSITRLPKKLAEESPPVVASGQAYNRLRASVEDVARIVGPMAFGDDEAETPRRTNEVYGVIVAAGPDGDSDYTDARYWVKSADVDEPSGTSNYDEYKKVGLTAKAATDDSLRWFTATNLAEAIAGTHKLSAGDFVVCRQLPDDSFRWVFERGVTGESGITFKIISALAGGGFYLAKSFTSPTADVLGTSDLAESDIGTLAATGDVIAMNYDEIGASTHLLTQTGSLVKVFNGRLIRTNTNGAKVVGFNGEPVKDC